MSNSICYNYLWKWRGVIWEWTWSCLNLETTMEWKKQIQNKTNKKSQKIIWTTDLPGYGYNISGSTSVFCTARLWLIAIIPDILEIQKESTIVICIVIDRSIVYNLYIYKLVIPKQFYSAAISSKMYVYSLWTRLSPIIFFIPSCNPF